MCVYTPSSPRHGWTGRVWSHERTIHEDRGGLPARLLSHWQREVSDGRRLARTHSYALTSLLPSVCTPLFTVHSYSLFFSPSSASCSTKTINLATILSLVAVSTSGPSGCCSSCHLLLFSALTPQSCCLISTYLCSFHPKLLPRYSPVDLMRQSCKTVTFLSISFTVNV